MKFPIQYTLKQMEDVQNFIEDTFGNGGDCLVGHEIESEYVHSDVAVVTTAEGTRCFATFGMGAREMNSPIADLARVELVMFASSEVASTSKAALAIASELQWLSKLPFQNDTWLGPGHTVTASDYFRKTFGFDAFALDVIAVPEFQEMGKIMFLMAIPIYQKEREKMMRENTMDVLEQLEEKFGVALYYADTEREPLVI